MGWDRGNKPTEAKTSGKTLHRDIVKRVVLNLKLLLVSETMGVSRVQNMILKITSAAIWNNATIWPMSASI